jgi:hypothetical protein
MFLIHNVKNKHAYNTLAAYKTLRITSTIIRIFPRLKSYQIEWVVVVGRVV